MHHNTYDRFSGSWWGSIIGQTTVNQTDFWTQPWLLERRQIAEMLLTEQLSTANLISFLALQSAGGRSNEINRQYHSNLLSLLPIIVVQNEPNLYLELAQKPNLSANSNICLSPDILIWGYLLTTVLNHHRGLSQKPSIEELFNPSLGLKTPAIDMLNIVLPAIKSGSSLHQLTEQLSSNLLQPTAIALAWYCFATTPHDFKLSVARAARIDAKLGWLTTILTSTLSGAYNGMAAISGNWRTDIEQNQSWDLENYLLLKLFRFWLGIYPGEENNQSSYSIELDAIALPQVIQPRQCLKIISQLSSS